MPGIFISYRRDDSEGYVGRLYKDLIGRFGGDAVFMDVATIKAGRDFRRVIDEQVSACGVLLVVIGRGWLEAKNESGERRLDLPTDAVRLEVAAALRRDIPVVPVLVQGARMPAPEKLPADLADLAFRNAMELTHPRWASDVELLIKALEADLGTSPGTHPAPSPEIRRSDVLPAVEPARPAVVHTDQPSPAGSNGSSHAASVARSRGPLVVGMLAALIVIGSGGIYFWHERTIAEQSALEAAAAAAEKAEAERIAALKERTEQEAREEAARLAAEKAAANGAALEKARREAAEAKAEAERLAADVRREKATAEAAARAQKAAAEAAAAEAREREAAVEARARDAAAELRARDAAAAEARARQAAEKQKAEPPAPADTPLTAWVSLREFFNLRQSQPTGRDFPYAFQASCARSDPFRVRGRFGAYPAGVSRFSYAVLSSERYQEANSARTSQGYKLYSRQSVQCPVRDSESKTIWVAVVWLQ